jgi:hypothetical protein
VLFRDVIHFRTLETSPLSCIAWVSGQIGFETPAGSLLILDE